MESRHARERRRRDVTSGEPSSRGRCPHAVHLDCLRRVCRRRGLNPNTRRDGVVDGMLCRHVAEVHVGPRSPRGRQSWVRRADVVQRDGLEFDAVRGVRDAEDARDLFGHRRSRMVNDRREPDALRRISETLDGWVAQDHPIRFVDVLRDACGDGCGRTRVVRAVLVDVREHLSQRHRFTLARPPKPSPDAPGGDQTDQPPAPASELRPQPCAPRPARSSHAG